MIDNFEPSPSNINKEDLLDNNVISLSFKSLETIPSINNEFVTVIYLQNNMIESLSDDFFPSLPCLKWLDMRDNKLRNIPKTIKNHQSLTHFLLQNNKITSLPNEIGTVPNLKLLQLSGNQIKYPPFDVIKAGTERIKSFLKEQFVEELQESPSNFSDKTIDLENIFNRARSYNSVLDAVKPRNNLSVQLSGKGNDSDEEHYSKVSGKCPRLPKSRSKTLLPYNQSSKYLKPLRVCSQVFQDEKMRESFLKDLALKKQKRIIEAADKILQGRRNMEHLKNWRKNYRNSQQFLTHCVQLSPKDFPYDTSPEYMNILTRRDIEKDLPDKFKRRLIRRSKPSVPRKSNEDVHLAMKIKQLFENLEAIDLNREYMTPRTEQKALLGEINKITEIKLKLKELSTSNSASVPNK